MNKIWVLMLIAGILCYGWAGLTGMTASDVSGLTGAQDAVSDAAAGFTEGLLSSCEEAVYFVIGLAGVMGLWSGFMNIARGSGLISFISKKSRRFMDYLFPQEKDPDTLMLMLMGFIANIFGAGNSATVFSLQAMKRMDESNPDKKYATDSMCMFAAVNMSMLQLVPISVIQIRAMAGSETPEDIIIPNIIAGLLATVASIAVCKYCENRQARLPAGKRRLQSRRYCGAGESRPETDNDRRTGSPIRLRIRRQASR